MTGIVMGAGDRAVTGHGRPQAGEKHAFDRPEKDEATLGNELNAFSPCCYPSLSSQAKGMSTIRF
jgi:hypothetical protein